MTQTAKTLVFVNLVLSVVFLAWAVGLLTNQVPWHNPPADEGPKVQGLVSALQDEIKRLVTARDSADLRWGDATVEVQQVEKRRADAQRYYADLLTSVRQGTVADIKPPVQQLAYAGSAVDISKRSGRPPVTINGENALSIAGYHQKIKQTLDEIDTNQQQVKDLIDQTQKLTDQINGTKPRPAALTAEEKGLRVQLMEQQELVHSLQLEQQYLRSPLTYYLLQREQLRQRQAALSARLDELKGGRAAAKR
jgi:septal ring factor EnvC (AmiA/AmiB activator)